MNLEDDCACTEIVETNFYLDEPNYKRDNYPIEFGILASTIIICLIGKRVYDRINKFIE